VLADDLKMDPVELPPEKLYSRSQVPLPVASGWDLVDSGD